MSDETEVEEQPPYEFKNSGVVYVTVGGQHKTLRAPLMGEFRRLRQSYVALREQAVDLVEPLRAEAVKVDESVRVFLARQMDPTARGQRIYELGKLDPLPPRQEAELERLTAADKAKPLTPAERKKGMEAQLRQEAIVYEMDDLTAELWGNWSRECFTAMGLQDVPAPEGLNPAFSTQRFVGELLGHWRDCPPDRGR